MSYIDKDLLDGETILYRGKLHWFIFVPAFLWMIAAAVLFAVLKHYNFYPVLSGVVGLYAFVVLINAFIVRISTELAVTNKRVIYKEGLISRRTIELTHNRIESIGEEQTVIDRIFGCGTLIIEGTGGGKEYMRNIDTPVAFKRQAQMALDQAGTGGRNEG